MSATKSDSESEGSQILHRVLLSSWDLSQHERGPGPIPGKLGWNLVF